MPRKCDHGTFPDGVECEQCIDERETADRQATDDDWLEELES
jgi:hypothetical protein